jgi:uncharacterized Zn-finger protein
VLARPEEFAFMEPVETIEVDDTTVACDGGKGALGHPRVFLQLAAGKVDCPYCGRSFQLKEGAEPAHH